MPIDLKLVICCCLTESWRNWWRSRIQPKWRWNGWKHVSSDGQTDDCYLYCDVQASVKLLWKWIIWTCYEGVKFLGLTPILQKDLSWTYSWVFQAHLTPVGQRDHSRAPGENLHCYKVRIIFLSNYPWEIFSAWIR